MYIDTKVCLCISKIYELQGLDIPLKERTPADHFCSLTKRCHSSKIELINISISPQAEGLLLKARIYSFWEQFFHIKVAPL